MFHHMNGRGLSIALTVLLVPLLLPAVLWAGGVTFHDVAADPSTGLTYERTPSARNQIVHSLKAQAPLGFMDFMAYPIKPRGAPGVVVFDADGDGDQDLYVTNGPGSPNSLFLNQLRETGALTFVDVGESAGVAAWSQDSGGAVAGDLDNDGDADLLVLGTPGPNRLFENDGDGTFTEITRTSGLGSAELTSQSASLADVNGDGLLDVFIANATDFSLMLAIFDPFPPFNQHNQLFINQGGNTFVDVSSHLGVEEHAGFAAGFEHLPTFTHVCALVDLDGDGDADLLTGDDQGAVPTSEFGGLDNGLLHFFANDGTGHLDDVSPQIGLGQPGGWMGIAVADFDGNGRLDVFATNVGTYQASFGGVPRAPGEFDSRWFLQQSDGTFTDPGIGGLLATPFGWGTSAADYDNDGDTDIVFHGGIDFGPFGVGDNPGVILENDGAAGFTWDAQALAGSTDHSRRAVHGMAVGDLDEDGFVDLVSVSNHEYPAPLPMILQQPVGSVFDTVAYLWPTWVPTEEDPDLFVPAHYMPPELPNGSLSVEISSGGNGHGSVSVDPLGTVGWTPHSRVNRDGVGAVLSFRPAGGPTATLPVMAGSSYASQDSGILTFGLGTATGGDLEILWPGGVRNRLYDVAAGERIVLPEIPCSFDVPGQTEEAYVACVAQALNKLVYAGVIEPGEERQRLFLSAKRAFEEGGTL